MKERSDWNSSLVINPLDMDMVYLMYVFPSVSLNVYLVRNPLDIDYMDMFFRRYLLYAVM